MIQTRNFSRLQLVLVFFLVCASSADAGDWEVTPRFTLGEIFSDNINLDDDDKESDLTTEISPGISIHGVGGRLTADIDYDMQNTIYASNSNANGTFHQLDANATAEMAKNLFFVDASGAMGQALVSADSTISTDNLNNAGNRTDFSAYSLSPYLKPHFGGYADGLFRYTYSEVKYDDSVSDANTNSFDADIVSGRKFGPLSWSAGYNYSDEQRNSASNTTYENANGQARYRISKYFSLVGQGGYANNDYNSSEEVENGTYWAIGGFLQPSRYYSLEAQQGNNLSTATVGLYPTRRTSLVVTYRDRQVGLNPGEVWSGSFSHYTRRTTWNASYLEDTTTQQQQVLQDGGFVFWGFIDPITGERHTDPQPGDLVVFAPVGPIISLTNEVIERKRASGSFGIKTGKTGLLVSVFDERRKYLTSLTEEETKGVSGSVNRQLAPRTNGVMTASYQRTTDDGTGSDTENTFMFLQAGVTRQIGRKLNGSLYYRYSVQDSRDGDNDYTENRIEARLTALF
jgi:uncharacterized protein (PEP-CTERM system associated)